MRFRRVRNNLSNNKIFFIIAYQLTIGSPSPGRSLESLTESEAESNTSAALDEAQKYFQQSGILGQLRKSSKAFIANKSDAINVDRV